MTKGSSTTITFKKLIYLLNWNETFDKEIKILNRLFNLNIIVMLIKTLLNPHEFAFLHGHENLKLIKCKTLQSLTYHTSHGWTCYSNA